MPGFLAILRSMVRRTLALGFPGRSRAASSRFSGALPSEIPDSERLARFLFSKSHFRASDRTVKYHAFEPAADPDSGLRELSVSRIESLAESEIWSLGQVVASAGAPARTLHGRGDFDASVPRKLGLRPESDEPPIRHAVIRGWPEEKNARMSLAQQLAAEARLTIAPKA